MEQASLIKIGYKNSYARHFYKSQPLRSLAEVGVDIFVVKEEVEGVLKETVGEIN